MSAGDDGTVRRRSFGEPLLRLRLEAVAGPGAGRTLTSPGDSATIGSAQGNDLVLDDVTVSRFHVELHRREDKIEVVDLGSTNGTTIGPVLLQGGRVQVAAGTVLGLGDSAVRVGDGELIALEDGPTQLHGLIAADPAMRRLLGSIEKLGASEVPVLVLGESGTGKELVARAIHDASARAEEPFVTVDCAALSPALVTSELFGHERGSFTGADRRHVGAFERADGGTLFLDEIGELPPEIQASLLGALERRRIRRVGGSDEIAVDVRVVSATHRDLRVEVNSGKFRLDLFYRLAVAVLSVPALRDRPDDLPVLLERFLREEGHTGPVGAIFDDEAMKTLRAHRWPGNVREVRNLVRRALALGDAAPFELAGGADPMGAAEAIGVLLDAPYREARRQVTDAFEKRYLERVLERAEGNVRQAARLAEMDRSYLIDLIRRHGIK